MYKEYQILFAVGAENLSTKVMAAISEGWQPIGGVCVTQNKDVVKGAIVMSFVQAMVR